ncbi:MAG: hypothetical protein GF414_08535 [Candidatus Altiarchaeales archaeon]|nr:hypothetical protein [Candidatus Altiarchaeales archaeon]
MERERWWETIMEVLEKKCSSLSFCSEECLDRYFERLHTRAICGAIQKHDDELKDDPDRLDIEKFMLRPLDCSKDSEE